jgi:O-antigen/teichoic acid export membrane protein
VEDGGSVESGRDVSPESEERPQAAHLLVEGVPAAMSLAPGAPGVALGGELLLDREGHPGVESMRAGLSQAGPLAAAGVLANGANVIVTVALARILAPHSYGVLNQLTGLFLILSMPGSAVVVAVVRRVTMWHEDGADHLVRRWAGRLHRQCSLIVLVWGLVVFGSRHWIAVLLGQRSGIGIAAILTAAAFFVLLSLDRGLLQAGRGYRPLAANLLVEGGVRTVFVLALVAAGTGPSGAAVGILVAEVAAAAHARYVAVRAWSGAETVRVGRVSGSGSWRSGWLAALRPDPVLGVARSARRRVVVDLVIASVSLSMVAVLQNVDVLVVGRDDPSHSGAYAAVSVTSKAIVFGAIVLGGYLLPEAAIRWRQGSHALRQLRVVLVLLAVPAAVLLAVAFGAPRRLLEVVFHHSYTAASTALGPLVVAMILLSVTVILSMYLLAIGRRWVAGVLVAGALALGVAVAQVHGKPHATAMVDLAVQAGVVVVMVVGFTVVHRLRTLRPPVELS